MRSKLFFAACLLIGICLNSCNNKKSTLNKNKQDIVWNDKIQDTFFGLTLGDTVDADFAVANMRSKGFYFQDDISTNTLLHFRNRDSKYFSFGGLSFEMLDIFIGNNMLCGICFMNSTDDKASALANYNNIKAALDAKYSPTTVAITDTTTYAKCQYRGKNETYATVACYRYQAVSKKIHIGTDLYYRTFKGQEKASDEL